MLWMTLALAMDEPRACEPVRMRTLAAAVEDARVAFAALEIVEGQARLADARAHVLCLNAPMPPEMLGEFAWLEAESAIWSHEVESAWPWVRLATDLQVTPPAHLGGRHPMQRWLTSMPSAPEIAGPTARLDGGKGHRVVVDGQLLDPPRVRTQTPHLVQLFEGRDLVEAWWQQGNQFRGTLLVPLVEPPTAVAKGGTVAYWEQWLVQNPSSQWVEYAREQLDGLKLAAAVDGGGAGLEAYLADAPGAGQTVAKVLLEPMDFDRASVSGSRRALESFIAAHPGGRFVGDAERLLEALDWELTTEQDTAGAYEGYLAAHPDGRSALEARRRLAARLVTRAQRAGDDVALAQVEVRFPWSIAGARAGALARGDRMVNVVLGGDSNEELVTALRSKGLVVERAPREPFGRGTGLEARTGMVWSEVADVDGWYHARAELWMVDGRAPVATWRVQATDEESARSLLAAEMPPIDDWIPSR